MAKTTRLRFDSRLPPRRPEPRSEGRPRSRGSRLTVSTPARNVGVSVVRAGRELELDQGWASSYEPRERWWGVEVSFDPGLDDLFGVSNNKQFARNFAEAARLDTGRLAKNTAAASPKRRASARRRGRPYRPAA